MLRSTKSRVNQNNGSSRRAVRVSTEDILLKIERYNADMTAVALRASDTMPPSRTMQSDTLAGQTIPAYLRPLRSKHFVSYAASAAT